MFDTVVSRLRDERLSVAIFPEGTSHSGPHVLELKVRAVSHVFSAACRPQRRLLFVSRRAFTHKRCSAVRVGTLEAHELKDAN